MERATKAKEEHIAESKIARAKANEAGIMARELGEKLGIDPDKAEAAAKEAVKAAEEVATKSKELEKAQAAKEALEKTASPEDVMAADDRIANAKTEHEKAQTTLNEKNKKVEETPKPPSPQERAALEKQLEEAQDTQRAETNVADSHDAEVNELNETIGKNNTIKQSHMIKFEEGGEHAGWMEKNKRTVDGSDMNKTFENISNDDHLPPELQTANEAFKKSGQAKAYRDGVKTRDEAHDTKQAAKQARKQEQQLIKENEKEMAKNKKYAQTKADYREILKTRNPKLYEENQELLNEHVETAMEQNELKRGSRTAKLTTSKLSIVQGIEADAREEKANGIANELDAATKTREEAELALEEAKAKGGSDEVKAEAEATLTKAQQEEKTAKTNLAQAKKTPEELAREQLNTHTRIHDDARKEMLDAAAAAKKAKQKKDDEIDRLHAVHVESEITKAETSTDEVHDPVIHDLAEKINKKKADKVRDDDYVHEQAMTDAETKSTRLTAQADAMENAEFEAYRQKKFTEENKSKVAEAKTNVDKANAELKKVQEKNSDELKLIASKEALVAKKKTHFEGAEAARRATGYYGIKKKERDEEYNEAKSEHDAAEAALSDAKNSPAGKAVAAAEKKVTDAMETHKEEMVKPVSPKVLQQKKSELEQQERTVAEKKKELDDATAAMEVAPGIRTKAKETISVLEAEPSRFLGKNDTEIADAQAKELEKYTNFRRNTEPKEPPFVGTRYTEFNNAKEALKNNKESDLKNNNADVLSADLDKARAAHEFQKGELKKLIPEPSTDLKALRAEAKNVGSPKSTRPTTVETITRQTVDDKKMKAGVIEHAKNQNHDAGSPLGKAVETANQTDKEIEELTKQHADLTKAKKAEIANNTAIIKQQNSSKTLEQKEDELNNGELTNTNEALKKAQDEAGKRKKAAKDAGVAQVDSNENLAKIKKPPKGNIKETPADSQELIRNNNELNVEIRDAKKNARESRLNEKNARAKQLEQQKALDGEGHKTGLRETAIIEHKRTQDDAMKNMERDSLSVSGKKRSNAHEENIKAKDAAYTKQQAEKATEKMADANRSAAINELQDQNKENKRLLAEHTKTIKDLKEKEKNAITSSEKDQLTELQKKHTETTPSAHDEQKYEKLNQNGETEYTENEKKFLKNHNDKLSKALTQEEKKTYETLKKKDKESNFNPEDLDKAQKAHDAVKQQIKTNNDIVQIHRRIQQNQGLERVYHDTTDSALEQQQLLDKDKKHLEIAINKYITEDSLSETDVSHLSAVLETYKSLGGNDGLIKRAKLK